MFEVVKKKYGSISKKNLLCHQFQSIQEANIFVIFLDDRLCFIRNSLKHYGMLPWQRFLVNAGSAGAVMKHWGGSDVSIKPAWTSWERQGHRWVTEQILSTVRHQQNSSTLTRSKPVSHRSSVHQSVTHQTQQKTWWIYTTTTVYQHNICFHEATYSKILSSLIHMQRQTHTHSLNLITIYL